VGPRPGPLTGAAEKAFLTVDNGSATSEDRRDE
jgi:hypothetical protein